MILQIRQARQTVVLAGLVLGLVASGVSPLIEGHGVEAKKRASRAAAAGDVGAEAIQSFANSETVSLGPADTTAIEVSGFETPLADVDVTLHNLTQSEINGLDILLVGPGGQTAVIFSDVGGNSSANNLTVTLDDQAPGQLSSSAALTNGSFQPTNFDTADHWASPPSPVATPPSGSRLGVFNGTDPNGTWRLFFANDNVGATTGTMI